MSGPIRSIRHLYRWVVDNYLTATGVTTLTNKTLTAPVITTPDVTEAVEAGINLSGGNVTLSASQKVKRILLVSTSHATNAIIAPAENRTYLVVNSGAYAAIIKKSGGTGTSVPAGKAAVVCYNGSDYVTVATNEVTLAGAETLANKTLTAPDITFGVAAHDYDGGNVTWTLSASEAKALILTVTDANTGADIVGVPTAGKIYILANATTQTITIKASGKTGVGVATNKTAVVMGNGTDFVRITGDA